MLRANKRWSEEDKNFLIYNWGHSSIQYIAEKLGRSMGAVAEKAFVLRLGKAWKDVYSLSEVSRITGYTKPVVKRIMAELGITKRQWRGNYVCQARPQTKAYVIPQESLDRIIEYCKNLDGVSSVNQIHEGVWGQVSNLVAKPKSCRACGTTERPHVARGLCKRCHWRAWRKGTLNKYPKCRRRKRVVNDKPKES